MARLLRDLEQVLVCQHNVVGRWQMTRPQSRAAIRAVHNGEWQAPTTQVFVVGTAELSNEQRCWVALLHGGPGARLAGRTALTLHGWNQPLGIPIDVAIPVSVTRSKTPAWIRLHRIQEIVGPAAQPARVDVHRSVIQAASWARSDREAMFIVVSALQQRLVAADKIRQQLPRTCARRMLICDVTQEFCAGITSVNEHDFAALCRNWHLPEPVRQIRVYDGAGVLRAIDAEFRLPDGQVRRVEIEGMHHFEPSSVSADIDRHNELIVQGHAYLRVLSFTIKYEPERLRPILTRWVTGAAPFAA